MVTRIRSRIALVFVAAGVVFVIAALVLPLVKTPQTAIGTGPTLPYGNLNSTQSGYLIPEVDKGSLVNIVVTGYTPGSLAFFLFPTSGDLSPSGVPLYKISNITAPILRISFASPETQAYGIYIDSTNRTQFVIAVSGTWSPYYYLRGYISEGTTVILVGLLAFSYFRYYEYRKRTEEEATREVLARAPEAPAS